MSGTAAEVDGRRLRRQQNREAVLEALASMFSEGDYTPSSADIAERAGLSPRSLFRYFDDVDDLNRAAIERQQATALPLVDPGVGPLEPTADKIRAVAEARVRLFEAIAPLARAVRVVAHRHPLVRGGDQPEPVLSPSSAPAALRAGARGRRRRCPSRAGRPVLVRDLRPTPRRSGTVADRHRCRLAGCPHGPAPDHGRRPAAASLEVGRPTRAHLPASIADAPWARSTRRVIRSLVLGESKKSSGRGWARFRPA